MMSRLVDLEILKKDAGKGYEGMIQLFDSVLNKGANELLKAISTVPKLRARAIELDTVHTDDAGQLHFDKRATLGDFAELANLSLAPRICLSEKVSKKISIEECKRLITFPMGRDF